MVLTQARTAPGLPAEGTTRRCRQEGRQQPERRQGRAGVWRIPRRTCRRPQPANRSVGRLALYVLLHLSSYGPVHFLISG